MTEQDPTDVSEEAADAPTETEDDASFGQARITQRDCDNAGEDCIDGLCTLTSQPALCCDDEVCPDGLAAQTATAHRVCGGPRRATPSACSSS